MKTSNAITIKSPEEIVLLREAGRILVQIIKELKRSLKADTTTGEIEQRAKELMAGYQVRPAFEGYRGFPGSVCISVNEEVVHGIPGPRILREGDIVTLDVGIIYQEYFSDTAVTVGIGTIDGRLQRLLSVAEQALSKGIAQAKVNHHLSDISFAIQNFVESQHFSVVRDFVGHGIGKHLHEDPEIPNFGQPHSGPVLREGMVLAIEPMVNMGTWQTKVKEDGWTVVTADGKPSAHFEHTVLVTSAGPEVLTR